MIPPSLVLAHPHLLPILRLLLSLHPCTSPRRRADVQSSPSATPAPTASRSIPRATSSSATPTCSASSSSRDTASLSRVSFPHLTLERASPTVSSAAGRAIASACTLRRAPPGGSVMWIGTTRARRPCGPAGRTRNLSRDQVMVTARAAQTRSGMQAWYAESRRYTIFSKGCGRGAKRPSSCVLTPAGPRGSLEATGESAVTSVEGLRSVHPVGLRPLGVGSVQSFTSGVATGGRIWRLETLLGGATEQAGPTVRFLRVQTPSRGPHETFETQVTVPEIYMRMPV